MKKFWKYLGLSILTVFFLGVIGFLGWASNPAQPEIQALDSLQSNQEVHYEEIDQWLVFTPTESDPTIGLILYPGARVDARAYAPLASQIAQEGYAVIMVPMPLNFAFLGIDRASEVIRAFPYIEHWVIGGHSLGGAMAAEYAESNPSAIKGLILWAAYAGDNTDLSDSDLAVASIFASNDGLATPQEITNSQARLPDDTIYTMIAGGNHAGFGWYGPQNGDGIAEISKDEQQNHIVAATINLLEMLQE